MVEPYGEWDESRHFHEKIADYVKNQRNLFLNYI